MARKNVLEAFKMMNAADLSANAESSVVTVKNLDNLSIILDWTGTSPVGVVTIQVRNYRDQNTASSWVTLDLGSAINISGNSGTHLIEIDEITFSQLKVVYTRTSGAGSMDAIITGRQVGG